MPYTFRFVWSWVKPMLAAHAQEKVRFIDDEGGLLEFVEPRWLLQKYGGDAVYDPTTMSDASEFGDKDVLEPEPEPELEPEPSVATVDGEMQSDDDEEFFDALPGVGREEALMRHDPVTNLMSTVVPVQKARDSVACSIVNSARLGA